MPYYRTLAEDVARAKEILAKGKAASDMHLGELLPDHLRAEMVTHAGGAIYGADTYAAYKLLESFVEAIEAVGPKVCELALRVHQRSEAIAAATAKVNNGEPPSITCPRCSMTSYHLKDISERYCGNCHLFHDQMVVAECSCRTPGCGHPAEAHAGGRCTVCGREGCWS